MIALALTFFIYWTAPQSVMPDTQQAIITGGALQSMEVAADGKSGIISVSAPRECLTIDWSARTTGGVYLHTIRSWRDGCDKFYVPLL